jgi:hypothetical protein
MGKDPSSTGPAPTSNRKDCTEVLPSSVNQVVTLKRIQVQEVVELHHQAVPRFTLTEIETLQSQAKQVVYIGGQREILLQQSLGILPMPKQFRAMRWVSTDVPRGVLVRRAQHGLADVFLEVHQGLTQRHSDLTTANNARQAPYLAAMVRTAPYTVSPIQLLATKSKLASPLLAHDVAFTVVVPILELHVEVARALHLHSHLVPTAKPKFLCQPPMLMGQTVDAP